MTQQSSTRALEIPKVYSMPAASPMYPPPPYQYRGNRWATVFFRSSPEALDRLVPAPLQPNPDCIVAFYFALISMKVPIEFGYKEVGILVPVAHGETQGLYCAYMYLDTVAPIVVGREIWGFPKKEASIALTEEGGEVSVVVSHFGFPLIKAAMRPETRIEVIPESPYQAFFNLKVIPSARRNAPPDVLQLTSMPHCVQTSELYQGPGTLEFGPHPFEPLGNIPILEIVGAQLEVQDMMLDYGEIAIDYLAR
jgi:acetoacetate decarboxylase